MVSSLRRSVRRSRQRCRATRSGDRLAIVPTQLSSARVHVRVPAELRQVVSDRGAVQSELTGCDPHIEGATRSIRAPHGARTGRKMPSATSGATHRDDLDLSTAHLESYPRTLWTTSPVGYGCWHLREIHCLPGVMRGPTRRQSTQTISDGVPFFPFGINDGTFDRAGQDCPERE